MDAVLEDKICDLYDLFVEGLDEDSGSQVRKLYMELAQLWPSDLMDNHGIKRAICRAKERRRVMYSRNKDQEKIKSKKMLTPRQEEGVRIESGSVAQPQNVQERLATDPVGPVLALASKPVPNSTAAFVQMGVDGALPKKKVKRKPELELDETHLRSEKLHPQSSGERHQSLKNASGLPQKLNLQSAAPPSVVNSDQLIDTIFVIKLCCLNSRRLKYHLISSQIRDADCLCKIPCFEPLSPFAGILSSCSCPYKLNNRDTKLAGFGFELQGRERLKRKLKFVVSAELSRSFSENMGLDSKNIGQSHDLSQLPWIGPIPGDIAEVEAYCRIFRAAERLHAALMDTICNPLTGECKISYDYPSEEKPLLENKIVPILGCILSLLNKGREDVLSGRSSIMNSFRVAEASVMEDKLPPLAIFRSEMKRCCESLHVALENFLTPDDDRSLGVWRKLQRLKNVCYDSGFPRRDDHPCHMLFANWNAVYFSTSREDLISKSSESAFWKGGQVTEEGLNWLLERGFKTIVDLRAEIIKDNFYDAAVNDAIAAGKVELIKIAVEVSTAPSMEQVEKFASLVSDSSKKPIYLHSKEGVWRTSAMVSRWRQYMTRSASVITTPRDMGLRENR
ncbi:hypothetical protein OIU78_012358 [Salix suchowensis]|nr:hypothetical protein OIU78_012358 [Salix suchowensis]